MMTWLYFGITKFPRNILFMCMFLHVAHKYGIISTIMSKLMCYTREMRCLFAWMAKIIESIWKFRLGALSSHFLNSLWIGASIELFLCELIWKFIRETHTKLRFINRMHVHSKMLAHGLANVEFRIIARMDSSSNDKWWKHCGMNVSIRMDMVADDRCI